VEEKLIQQRQSNVGGRLVSNKSVRIHHDEMKPSSTDSDDDDEGVE